MNLYFSSLLLVKEQNLPYLQAGREVFQSGDCFSMLINCIPYCLLVPGMFQQVSRLVKCP